LLGEHSHNERNHDGAFELATDRLVLRPITRVDITAILEDRPLSDWASDYPADGDQVIARLLSRVGVPSGDSRPYGHRLVVEPETGQVVGGVGFVGPPQDGREEIVYGIV
jgi:ribosomal-protein-alanine N-acetyltransferase